MSVASNVLCYHASPWLAVVLSQLWRGWVIWSICFSRLLALAVVHLQSVAWSAGQNCWVSWSISCMGRGTSELALQLQLLLWAVACTDWCRISPQGVSSTLFCLSFHLFWMFFVTFGFVSSMHLVKVKNFWIVRDVFYVFFKQFVEIWLQCTVLHLSMLLNTELLCDHGLNLTDNRWVL